MDDRTANKGSRQKPLRLAVLLPLELQRHWLRFHRPPAAVPKLGSSAWRPGNKHSLISDFLSCKNLGTLEGSRIVARKAVGVDALLGMTFGVAVRVAQVFW